MTLYFIVSLILFFIGLVFFIANKELRVLKVLVPQFYGEEFLFVFMIMLISLFWGIVFPVGGALGVAYLVYLWMNQKISALIKRFRESQNLEK